MLVAETCIVAITVISYILPKRQDLVPYFEQALAQNIDNILMSNNPKSDDPLERAKTILVRARLALMLGYYADMLFVKHNAAFEKTMNFLFESVNFQKDTLQHVIALQCIDTLCTVVSDSDLAPRLTLLLPTIIVICNNLTPVVQLPQYFEFLLEFVKFYN